MGRACCKFDSLHRHKLTRAGRRSYKIDNALHLNEFNLETISKFISSLLHVLSVDENDSSIFSTVSTYTSSPGGSAVDEPDLEDRDHPRGYEDDNEHEAKAEFNPDATPEATQPAGETEASAPAAAASSTTTSCVGQYLGQRNAEIFHFYHILEAAVFGDGDEEDALQAIDRWLELCILNIARCGRCGLTDLFWKRKYVP